MTETQLDGVETFEAVVRRDTVIDEKEHILNFLPRSSVID